MPEDPSQNNNHQSTQRPGPLLKQAREKMELSRKDIATQLNLQTEIIEALEEDRTEQLPAATYARGYIRSYARIVKLDGEELIRLFDSEPVDPPEIIPDIKTASQASSQDKPVRAVTYLVTFILALLLVAWLQSNYVVEKDMADVPADSEGYDSMDSYEELPSTSSNPFREQPGISSGQNNDLPAEEGLSNLQINEQAGIPEVDEGIISNMALSDIAGFEAGSMDSDSADTGADEEENADSAGSLTDDNLVLKLEEDSWIEVYDSGDNRLYLGLGKAGEEIKLSG